MIITCEQCHTRLKVAEALLNRPVLKIKCPKCQHLFKYLTTGEADIVELDSHSIISECQVISICNQKGGVAKTSTCLNLGAALAIQYKVLIVDFDVLANLTIALGFDKGLSFYDVLKSPTLHIQDVLKVYSKNLSILPSNNDMNLLPKRYLQTKQFECLLSGQLKSIRQDYDFILIDTPPSMEFFTLNALIAADLVIIPSQCEYFSMNGVAQVKDIIDKLNNKYKKNKSYRVLITMYDKNNMAAKVIFNKLKHYYNDKLLNTIINYDAKIPESQIMNVPVVQYAKNSLSAKQYLALAQEISS